MKKKMLGFGIALLMFFIFSGYAMADDSTISDAYVCVIALKIDAAADAGSFSLFETCEITVYTTKACNSPIDADVNGTITRPTGIVDTLNFTRIDTGVYRAYYMFNSTGNYMLYVEAVNETWWTQEEYGGKVWIREYISVPFLSMYLSLPYGTQYQVGDQVRIWGHVEDSNGLPINDADVNITVFYPNLTAYISNQNMTFFMNGDYYHTFTAPEAEGQYFVQVEARKNFSYQSKSKTFMVGGWATQIGEINQTLHDVVIPYLQDINYTVHNISDIVNNLNITASNLDYLIYELVQKINSTQGNYNVTMYNDSTVETCSPGSELKQVVWRYDNESEPGVIWIRYRACANATYEFSGTLNLTNVEILNSSCYNCSGDSFLVGPDSLSFMLTTDYEKGWDIKVKLVRKTGTATFDGLMNGTRYPDLSYLGSQVASSLPFTFYVGTTKLSSTVFGSIEDLKDDVNSIMDDLQTIQDQIAAIDVGSSYSTTSSGGSRINNYYYGTNASLETLQGLDELLEGILGGGNASAFVDLNDIYNELRKARDQILRALEYQDKKREAESTGLAALFSGLETASTITMLLGLVFVILVVGVFLYIIWSGREDEDSFSKILMMKMLMRKRDGTSRLLAYSILSGKKSYMDKLFKFMLTKDMIEGEEEDNSDVKRHIKKEIKNDVIRRIRNRVRR